MSVGTSEEGGGSESEQEAERVNQVGEGSIHTSCIPESAWVLMGGEWDGRVNQKSYFSYFFIDCPNLSYFLGLCPTFHTFWRKLRNLLW